MKERERETLRKELDEYRKEREKKEEIKDKSKEKQEEKRERSRGRYEQEDRHKTKGKEWGEYRDDGGYRERRDQSKERYEKQGAKPKTPNRDEHDARYRERRESSKNRYEQKEGRPRTHNKDEHTYARQEKEINREKDNLFFLGDSNFKYNAECQTLQVESARRGWTMNMYRGGKTETVLKNYENQYGEVVLNLGSNDFDNTFKENNGGGDKGRGVEEYSETNQKIRKADKENTCSDPGKEAILGPGTV